MIHKHVTLTQVLSDALLGYLLCCFEARPSHQIELAQVASSLASSQLPLSVPFNLQPLFQKGGENWFEKNGSSNLDFFSGLKKYLTRKKVGLYHKYTFFFQVGVKWFCKLGFFYLVREKQFARKKKYEFEEQLFQNDFSRRVVAD